MKREFNPQKDISLLQHGRRFFVYSSNMAAVTSCEHTLLRNLFQRNSGDVCEQQQPGVGQKTLLRSIPLVRRPSKFKDFIFRSRPKDYFSAFHSEAL